MDYGALEDEVTDWLRGYAPLNSIATINASPINEGEFDKFYASYQKPAVAVCYGGTMVESHKDNIGRVLTLGPVTQQADVILDIIVGARGTRGPIGVFKLLELIQLRLIGYKPTNCRRKIYLLEQRLFERSNNGIFIYNMKLATETIIVEDDNVNPVMPATQPSQVGPQNTGNYSGPPITDPQVNEIGINATLIITE